MAHLRRHKRSPYWYVRSRDLDTGAWHEQSTGFKAGNGIETRKAQRLADRHSAQERQVGLSAERPAFALWVPSYLANHWTNPNSQRRYANAWNALRLFLASQGIIYPRQVKYAHGAAYMKWRTATAVHGKQVRHNTALLELKFLSQLLNEAIKREHAESNPIARLGIGRRAAKIKPELTDDEIALLRRKLSGQPEWMRTCFEIALYTGCRFSECEIPLSDIDLAAGTIRLRDAKRGESDPRKYFTVPIHRTLVPLLQQSIAVGNDTTCILSRDKNGRINSFFRQHGVQASFHSLRVTFITRCHRGGLSESEAMRLVNHSSQLVHRIYSRLNVDDVRKALARIPLPS